MDPNETLNRILRVAGKVIAAQDSDAATPTRAAELAELALALHDWIVSGGGLPDAWHKGQLQGADDPDSDDRVTTAIRNALL